jgi:small subunit ribosomal protein S17e
MVGCNHICTDARERPKPVVCVGKVRTELVKSVSTELVKRYPRSFTIEFEENKRFLHEIGLDTTKRLRNKVAGYITRIMRIELDVVQ